MPSASNCYLNMMPVPAFVIICLNPFYSQLVSNLGGEEYFKAYNWKITRFIHLPIQLEHQTKLSCYC
jgi:hypothetical protein